MALNIILTGSEGFIGKHVQRLLAEQQSDANVLRVDIMEERVHGVGAEAPEGVLWRSCGDIDYATLSEADCIIHLGAQVSVADSMEDPFRYYHDNTEDTLVMLDNLRRIKDTRGDEAPLKKIVVASSMSIYGDGGAAVHEGNPACPESVYALTKYDQERLVLMFAPLLGCKAAALRFFNCFGPGQALDNGYTGVLAIFAKRLLNDQPPIIYEDGSQTRDFIYVEDLAQAVVNAALLPEAEGVFNIGTGQPTDLLTATAALQKALGKEHIKPVITGEHRPGDVMHCWGTALKAIDGLKWMPQHTFEQGIEKYAEWLRSL